MKKNILLSLALVSALILGGCSKFEDVNTNPDVTTSGNSAMLATGLIKTMAFCSGNGNNKNYVRDDMLAKYIAWTEASDIDIAFNQLDRASFADIAALINADKMVEAAPEDLKSSYEGLAHFVRVWVFFNATMRVGDIPYSEAVQCENEIYFPKYDSQKAVFAGLLKELDEAEQCFAKGSSFSGDFLYGGNCELWRKACNVMQMKILINLYKKTSDSDLNVKGRFAALLSKPLFTSINDNLQIVYSNKANQKFPLFYETNSFCSYDQISNVMVDKLKELKDYRLFAYAAPTPNATGDAADWDSYNGVEPCQPESSIQSDVNTGIISPLNDRYEKAVDCEPTFLLSYQEMNFILAEACVRGLISGNAADYYAEGIRSSMQFVAEHSVGYVPASRVMTDSYVADYIASPEVAFAATEDAQIEQIIWQKYITTFLQTPYNAFFEYRRTGVPALKIDPLSNRNNPSDKMPLKWLYPSAELNYNMENVSAAIASQYGGSDDYMGVMWILK